MRVVRNVGLERGRPRRPLPAELPRSAVVSIGNFDGVHLGHRAILDETVRRARELGVPAVAITFEPHPLEILAPDRAPQRLQTPRQKERAIETTGIDVLVVIVFTRDFSLTPAEEFVSRVLVEALDVREVVIGSDFCFGRDRSGDLAALERLGRERGFRAAGIPSILDGGDPISSSRIRRAIAEGRPADATRMLGRPYALEGIVARGAQLGRRLGFPTLNVHPEVEIRPGAGVYVTQLELVAHGSAHPSVTNVGTRPTVDDVGLPTIETHVLDFDADVYGETVQLELLERIREEHRFASVTELAAQIGRDVEAARAWFRQHAAGDARTAGGEGR